MDEEIAGIKREMMRFLEGIENGSLSANDAFIVADKLDPVLVYFAIQFLRENYPASNPGSQGITERMVELMGNHEGIVKAVKTGEKDVLSEWFNDTYSFGEFKNKNDEFVDLIVDKLEG